MANQEFLKKPARVELISRMKANRGLGFFLLIVGFLAGGLHWLNVANSDYFFPIFVILFPPFILVGLGLLLFPGKGATVGELAEGGEITDQDTTPSTLRIIVFLFLALGGLVLGILELLYLRGVIHFSLFTLGELFQTDLPSGKGLSTKPVKGP